VGCKLRAALKAAALRLNLNPGPRKVKSRSLSRHSDFGMTVRGRAGKSRLRFEV